MCMWDIRFKCPGGQDISCPPGAYMLEAGRGTIQIFILLT